MQSEELRPRDGPPDQLGRSDLSQPMLDPATPTVGEWADPSYENKHGSRSYRLYIPSGYRGQPVPLVVMLHGCTQDPDDFAAGIRMNELADRTPSLVAYPAQPPAANGRRCWNWFEPAHQERDRGEPSIIAGLTRQITAAYTVDSTRVYVGGMSAGGAMAAVLGATYPDLFAAIGVHSGLAYRAGQGLLSAWLAMKAIGICPHRRAPVAFAEAGAVARVVPLIAFHGDADETVMVTNGHQLVTQWARSNALAHDGVENATTVERPAQVTEVRAPDGHAYTRFVYGAGKQVIMEKWIVHGLGHAWSGGSPAGSYTDPRGPSASEQMLRFFRDHRLGSSLHRPLADSGPVGAPNAG